MITPGHPHKEVITYGHILHSSDYLWPPSQISDYHIVTSFSVLGISNGE